MTMLSKFKQHAPSKSTLAITLAVGAAAGCALAIHQTNKKMGQLEEMCRLNAQLALGLANHVGTTLKQEENQ